MNGGVDEGCRAIINLKGLDPNKVHRFIVGRDQAPISILAGELHDPFAELLLEEPPFPRSSDDLVSRFQAAIGLGDPRGQERSFLVGEGSQIPIGKIPFDSRTLRFVVALGNPEVDVILSAFDPRAASIELMAWDAREKGFNFYRTTEEGAWVFAGNSADAVRPDTEGKGPFESHKSGNFLMKELRFPWVHWQSFKAEVNPNIFEGRLGGHRWLRKTGDGNGTLHGADVCEEQVAIRSVDRWTAARFDAIKTGMEPLRPRRILEQVITSPTVNLVSSQTTSSAAKNGSPVEIPPQFLVDSETLADPQFLGLDAPPRLLIPPTAYEAVLREFDVRLSDGRSFVQQGDTFFAFVVPVRAVEDIAVVKAAVGTLITERLAAALLMVDFANPVLSAARERLLQHVPIGGDLRAGPEQFSETVAELVRAAADGGPEKDFIEVWDAGDNWREKANAMLRVYYSALERRLADDPLTAFRDWFQLAESRRRHAKQIMPIFEFPLLLAESNAPAENLAMRADATVVR